MSMTVKLLIVSSRLEVKRALLRILDGLPLNIYVAGTVKQAQDALQRHAIDILLCDQRILDGAYQDVLALTVDKLPKIQFILLLALAEPDERQRATRLGVSEVIHSPFEPTDVELALIHVMGGGHGQAAAAQTA